MIVNKQILKQIPDQHKFEYLRCSRRIEEIQGKLKGYIPQTKEDQKWIEGILAEYNACFRSISTIEREVFINKKKINKSS